MLGSFKICILLSVHLVFEVLQEQFTSGALLFLNHFVLIAVCSAEFLVVRLRICTGFKEISFRETHL